LPSNHILELMNLLAALGRAAITVRQWFLYFAYGLRRSRSPLPTPSLRHWRANFYQAEKRSVRL
jgi:hypothetical protein